MISTVDLSPLNQWRKRFGGRRRRRDQPWPQAALGYLTDGPVVNGLIEIEKLTFVLLYDEPIPGGPCRSAACRLLLSPYPLGRSHRGQRALQVSERPFSSARSRWQRLPTRSDQRRIDRTGP